ncbi:MAG TPA: YciI family protein [Candidatus Binataceae bacterium]
MKFMVLLLIGEGSQAQATQTELRRVVEQTLAVEDELVRRRKYVDSHRLRPESEAVTIRMTPGGGQIVESGPYAGAGLRGYFIVESESIDEAVEWTRKFPLSARMRAEIRPIQAGNRISSYDITTAGRKRPKFLLIFCGSEANWDAYSEKQQREAVDKHNAIGAQLFAQQKFLDGSRLMPRSEAKTVSVKDGLQIVVDGPFAETKEVLGGYFLIESDSMEEAIEWGKKTTFGYGGTEVRQVWETE